MAEEFDRDQAMRRQREIITEVQEIRNLLNHEVIDYYYDRAPDSETEVAEHQEGMRRFLRRAAERIDGLLRGDLR